MRGEGNGPSADARSILVVVEEIDGDLFNVSALVIVLDRVPIIFYPFGQWRDVTLLAFGTA